jgi:hypothetical protein
MDITKLNEAIAELDATYVAAQATLLDIRTWGRGEYSASSERECVSFIFAYEAYAIAYAEASQG